MTDLKFIASLIDRIKKEVGKRIIGNDENIDLILNTMFSRGHVLLEGVPGIAKSYLASTIAEVIGLSFKRIQFVPDLLPSDITGSSIYDMKNQEFKFIKGPIFANIVLTDEINRAPPKTQAAMLEGMQEKQVSIEGTSYSLPIPFFVIATQNPIEQVGTYQLPEAQLDRFMIRINMNLPGYEDELALLKSKRISQIPNVEQVATKIEIEQIREEIEKIEISDEILDYIARLIVRTRFVPSLTLGGSPRASIALLNMGRARAAMAGRKYVEPDDIKYLLYYVINHRLILTPEAEVQQLPIEQIIERVIRDTPVSI